MGKRKPLIGRLHKNSEKSARLKKTTRSSTKKESEKGKGHFISIWVTLDPEVFKRFDWSKRGVYFQ